MAKCPMVSGPEMLMELSYRLAVEETPFIQNIRKNVITFITPVIEVDGREKQVDTWYFNKQRPAGTQRLPLMYWGKYVAHDNNRDAMRKGRRPTKAPRVRKAYPRKRNPDQPKRIGSLSPSAKITEADVVSVHVVPPARLRRRVQVWNVCPNAMA